jgi:hypothetical protein
MDRGFTYPAGVEMPGLQWHYSGSFITKGCRLVIGHTGYGDLDDQSLWLCKAHAVIKAWEKQGFDTRLLTVREADALAQRIASALQLAYDQGRFASSSAADNT